MKKILWDTTGLHPNVQRLLFQGKEKDEKECLHISGVKDMSKVILMEDPASKELKKIQDTSISSQAIARVRVEVDKLSHRVRKKYLLMVIQLYSLLYQSHNIFHHVANCDFLKKITSNAT